MLHLVSSDLKQQLTRFMSKISNRDDDTDDNRDLDDILLDNKESRARIPSFL